MNHDENNNKNPLEEDLENQDNESTGEYSTTDSANNPPFDNESINSEYQVANQTELEHANEPTNELEKKASESNTEEVHVTGYETTNAKSKPKHKSQKRNLGISAIIGGLSGGLIAALTIVILLSNNIISIGDSPAEETNQSDSSSSDTEQVISTNVSDEDNIDFSVDEATKAVVGVSRLQRTNIWEPDQEAGTGSGIIYKNENDKAYVVTNHHVVAGAEDVQVTLSNEEKVPAKVLGSDELADLAVLEINGSNIDTVAKLGTSEEIQVGETVVAIGNPLGMEFSNSLTKGIISGLNRSVPVDTNGDRQPDWVTEVIQTDAAINPGNSGGALVNLDGEVIGINSMKIAQNAVEGIGFAIPIDTAKPIMEQLETEGKVARPYIGISVASIEEVPLQYRKNIDIPENFDGGVVIANVEQGSPAAKANLQQYDILTKINGEKIESLIDLRKLLYSEAKVGETIEIEFYHNGEKQTSKIELTERTID